MKPDLDASAFGACPAPILQHEHVILGHGSGGRLGAELVSRVFVSQLSGDAPDQRILASMEDSATLPLTLEGCGGRIAMTTDSFVVKPIFFPGGDIGRLAVCGTINDLAASGATPRYVSAAFILEEGLPIVDLARIVASMRRTCDEAGVALVTGDTKVVDRGKGDKVFITTTGVGVVPAGRSLGIGTARPGDVVIASGTLGDHGIAILSVREGLEFETVLESDCAPLHDLARVALTASPSRTERMAMP
jgi:hydrogenase expression/formation protein HypE